jgi:hypothetical protein
MSCPGTYLNRLHKHIASTVVTAAGDIACDPAATDFNGGNGVAGACRQKKTSDLLAGSDAVLALGDTQSDTGTGSAYARSYGPSWGRFLSITHPVPGDREYQTSGAGGYFDYFDAAAGDPAKGYYSFDAGAWHFVALNSNCQVVSCAAGSAQETWLKTDLAENAGKKCTLAFWHAPHFTDGPQAADAGGSTRAFWDDLYAAGADVVLNANDRNYQRFPPLRPDGATDDATGIREFVVGTGGTGLATPTASPAAAQREQGGTFGILRLTRWVNGYDWQFVPERGATPTFGDYGSQACH